VVVNATQTVLLVVQVVVLDLIIHLVVLELVDKETLEALQMYGHNLLGEVVEAEALVVLVHFIQAVTELQVL
jgi:hypothetical protein